ncbi:hypothetical protein [Stygiolobus azoricus]|uniref:Uncharacterized protein n=1 Tax=Stygiolobus azoricus TaxID=41675 RepID=A0A650CP85_9CREN|nr:hypothetical protein [Stygiolobus azoricus]QGR19654.1 hypothetical protein D1868_06355 [Stygiolobus azoricus]
MGVIEELDGLINTLKEENKRNEETLALIRSITANITTISKELYQNRVKEKLFSVLLSLNAVLKELEEAQRCCNSIPIDKLLSRKNELSRAVKGLYELSKRLNVNNMGELKELSSTLNEVVKTLEFLNEKVKEVDEDVRSVKEELGKKMEELKKEIEIRTEKLNSLNGFLRAFDEEVDFEVCEGKTYCDLKDCLNYLSETLGEAEERKRKIVSRIGSELEEVITKLIDEGEVEINDITKLASLLKRFEEDEKLRKLKGKLKVTLKLKGE